MSHYWRTLLLGTLTAAAMLFAAPKASEAQVYWGGYGGWYTPYYSYYTHPAAYYYPTVGYYGYTTPTYYYSYYQTPYTTWWRSPYYYNTGYAPVYYRSAYRWRRPLARRGRWYR